MRETRSLLSSAFTQETCHDLLRDHLSIRQLTWHVTMSASDRGTMSVYLRSEVRKRIGSPVGLRTYNPYVNNFQSPSQKGKVCDLFLAGIRCRDRKRQQLACLSVRFRSCMTKEQRRPQVKGHASGSAAAS